MPTHVVTSKTPADRRLAEVVAAVREYHAALDRREHGGVACHRAVSEIENILGLEWRAQS